MLYCVVALSIVIPVWSFPDEPCSFSIITPGRCHTVSSYTFSLTEAILSIIGWSYCGAALYIHRAKS